MISSRLKADIAMGKLVAAIGKLLCFVQVDQSTVGIKERFGKFEGVLDPGCHFVPWIIGNRVKGQLTLRLRQLDVRCETDKGIDISLLTCHMQDSASMFIIGSTSSTLNSKL